MHAGCLSISEGAPGWEDFLDKPFGPNCSLAMRKVAELRRRMEMLQNDNRRLANDNRRLAMAPMPGDWGVKTHGE
jgi:hypothetical protein